MARWKCAKCGTELAYPLAKLFGQLCGLCDECGGTRDMVRIEDKE